MGFNEPPRHHGPSFSSEAEIWHDRVSQLASEIFAAQSQHDYPDTEGRYPGQDYYWFRAERELRCPTSPVAG